MFVLTANPELNLWRVRSRVACGGHDVPSQKVRDRYWRSLANLPRLIELADVCTVMDNTVALDVIYRIDASGDVVIPSEYWRREAIVNLVTQGTVGEP